MRSIATIPAGEPFLDTLAQYLLADADASQSRGDPALALADAVVLLPTRRACRGFLDACLRAGGGAPLLLPGIQPIGEVDPDELLLDGEIQLDLPPAISPLRRQLMLTQVLAPLKWPLEHAFRLAQEMAALLDELAAEQIDLGPLEGLVPEALAEHWERNRVVLGIIAENWPTILADGGVIDAAERRHRLLTGLAARWRAAPPPGRVIAAGSTGSVPATRTLLDAVASLPRGLVVLPGLDLEVDEESWRQLGPSHPQFGLRQLLAGLEITRAQVTLLAVPGANRPQQQARRWLIAETMRPAATITTTSGPRDVPAAARAGLVIETHPDPPSEALALAQRMRAVLETPGRTAALVTPDRPLARRTAVELRRWGIEVDDSAGVPLDQTASGGFLLICARLIVEGVNAVTLLAALKHPLARGGLERATFRRRARSLELACLRGPRLAGGFAGILTELDRVQRSSRSQVARSRAAEIRPWVESLARIAGPFLEIAGQSSVRLPDLVRTHVAFAEALTRDPEGSAGDLWAGEAGEVAAALVTDLLDAATDDHQVAPAAYPAVLAHMMAERPVRPRAARHPRLFIWGELEARLQRTDLLLVGGLNEGVWPRPVDPGPWLNRTMRAQLGLPPVERRLGLAAHDFAQAACAPDVVLSRAVKDAQGNPTVPSRWLVRLQALVGGDGAQPAVLAEHPDAPKGAARATGQPQPRPPVAARPRQLSVSDIGTWMQDPYELYAKRILRLRPLDALDADPGALERGTMIHRILERFTQAYPEHLPDDAERRLLDLGREAFADYAHRPQVRALWWPRFEQIAAWVGAEERGRRARIAKLRAEVTGRLELDGLPGGPFVVNARADRIERRDDGTLAVIDYKTGSLPKEAELRSGLAPQLPLEAVMVAAGGFEDIEPGPVGLLEFWSLRGGEPGGVRKSFATALPDLAAAAHAGLEALVRHYDQKSTPYLARPRKPANFRRDYDHLARREEWPA